MARHAPPGRPPVEDFDIWLEHSAEHRNTRDKSSRGIVLSAIERLGGKTTLKQLTQELTAHARFPVIDPKKIVPILNKLETDSHVIKTANRSVARFVLVEGKELPREALKLERAIKFASAAVSGKTLLEIGAEEGLTKERVRQIIKSLGVSAAEIRALRIAKKQKESAKERLRKKEAKCYRIFGCSLKERSAVRKEIVSAYKHHKRYAAKCGVAFNISLPSYAKIVPVNFGRRKGGGISLTLMNRALGYRLGNIIAIEQTKLSRKTILRTHSRRRHRERT